MEEKEEEDILFCAGSLYLTGELRGFQPSLEVDDAEDAIYNNNTTDLADIFVAMMKESQDNTGDKK